ncbi:MAG: glycosyltransferase family 4 protein [Patescibacteria group bacterium]
MASRMKIAVVTPFGAEVRLDVFAEFVASVGLAARGDDVRMFTYRIRSNPEYVDKVRKGVRVFRCPQKVGFAPRLIWQILAWRPQVVMLCHIRSWLNLGAYVAARLVGAKVIFQVIGFLHDPYIVGDRDDPLETIFTKPKAITTLRSFLSCAFRTRAVADCWENFAFHVPLVRADVLVTITEFERRMVREKMGRDSIVIPWGVPLKPDVVERKPSFPSGMEPPETFLFYIGQVKRRKGWDTIVEALASLKQEGIRKHLVFVTSSSPEEYQEAIDRVAALDLSDQVTFLFRISNEEKAWLYARAEATLAPSRYEGFGLTVFESFAAGVPVLGTDIPVYDEFLKDGVTGLVSKKGDPRSFADNLKRLSDPELKKTIIAGGRQEVLKYTDAMIVERFGKLFQDVAAGRS